MITKYNIDYARDPRHPGELTTHRTCDAVETEDYLLQLLAAGARISTIRHEGVELEPHQFDRMIRIAAEGLIVRILGESLGADGAAIRHRFGFAS